MAKKKVRQQQAIPANESKSERFVRVVTPRVSKAVKAIDVIGFCAGSSYEYTPAHVEQITKALYASIQRLVDKFSKSAQSDATFGFKK